MRKFLTYILFVLVFTASFIPVNAFAGVEEDDPLSRIDLSQFNNEQQELIRTEVSKFSASVNELYNTNNSEYKKKWADFFRQIGHGFKIYNLTAENKDLAAVVKNFEDSTGLKVYVVSYVQGAFLNGLFQKLAELKYKIRQDSSIELKMKFTKVSTDAKDEIFNENCQVIASDPVKNLLAKLLADRDKKENKTQKTNPDNLYASTDLKGISIFTPDSDLKVKLEVTEILDRFRDLSIKATMFSEPFIVFETVGTTVDQQIEIKLAEILKDAKSMYLRQQAARYARVGGTIILAAALTLFPHESPQERIYDIALEGSSAIGDWYEAYGIRDFKDFSGDCEANDIAYKFINTWRLMEIQKDYLIYELAKEHYSTSINKKTYIGSEVVQIIPASLLNHPVIKKAISKGFDLNSNTNRMPVPRLFTAGQTPARGNYSNYANLLKTHLDKYPANLSAKEAYDRVNKIVCIVQQNDSYTNEKLTWGPEYSKYRVFNPFEDPSQYLDDWERIIVSPADEQNLRNLKLKLQADNLTEEELNLYAWLLCLLEHDCRLMDDNIKYELHHLIPQEDRIKNHLLVMLARQCSDKFLFDGEDNLLKLTKYNQQTGTGQHGNHPQYNDWIYELIDNELISYNNENSKNPSPCEAKELIMDLINSTLLLAIQNNPDKTVNEIGREMLKKLQGK